MKKWPSSLKFFAVLISLLLIFPATLVSAATAPASKIAISHKTPGEKYIPGFRINLDVTIAADSSLLATRCYFKTKNDQNFAFVDMFQDAGKSYKAVLPAPFVNSEAVNYLFVVVDSNKQVSRTEMYTIEEGETQEATTWKDINDVKEVRLDKAQDVAEKYIALYDKAKNNYNIPSYQKNLGTKSLKVSTELAKGQVPLNGFYDVATVSEVAASAKYGFLVENLYSADAVAAGGGTSATGASTAGTMATSAGLSTGAMLGIAGVVAVGVGVASSSGSSSDDSSYNPPVTPPVTPASLDATTILESWNYSGNRPDGVARQGTMNFSSGNLFSYTLVDADGQSDGSGTGSWTLSGSTLTLDAALTGSGTILGDSTTFNYTGHGTFIFTR